MITTTNQVDQNKKLLNGYDYKNQAWVINGVYVTCGHPPAGTLVPSLANEPFAIFEGCHCYGRLHAGEKANA